MDIFSTGVLARVVAELPLPAPFILNSFFRAIQTEASEEIHFDVDSGSRRLAPFVSPIVAGQVVQSKGYQTKTFKPAYVKDKRVFDASRPFKRLAGESIGGQLAPAQRLQLALATELSDQINMVIRRQEVMAIEALRTGKVTVTGDLYPTVEVNFGRDASLTKALAGATLHAAKALGLADSHGSLERGKVADFIAWDIQRPAELAYWLGGDLPKRVIRHGQEIDCG